MSDVDSIEITKYNSIDSISLGLPNEVTDISVSYGNQLTDISIEYENQITDIVLAIGGNVQSVYSVNGLVGTVALTATSQITSMSASGGIYSFNFAHNLGYAYPIVSIYSASNSLVFADVVIVDSNNVTIKSALNISGYRVVVQR